ncbi:MAG TPA: heterocyst frequency control protein PatD [Oscillatoriales cyanobacterium M59_W2019_021]|nr:MAG: hypothetical protein D6728_11180 [Cyanobacteria bacterium J055]HIK33032.1 heterocyst frequency control protein PatD [Oscillatoriales cyanobacterium M4454_W2019_049]HIK52709.1 heterocyst frequency control protein PatD [Oscillatoriales cyanobacterium M59_W2019_021]
MLSNDRQQRYRELREQLEELRHQGEGDSLEIATLKTGVDRAQQFLQSQVLPVSISGLNSAEESRTQSYHTELHKQLRLLATDVLFLGSARQASTRQQRQAQIRDRLTTLLRYCDILLEEDSRPAE